MTDIPALIRMRNRFLALAATSFLVWQGMQIADEWLPTSWAGIGAITLAGLVGSLGFVAAMVMFLVYAGRVTRTRSQDVIQDELFAFNQARALRIGYIALMVVITLGFILSDFVELPVELIIRGLMMVGVAVPIFAFLILDGGANEADDA